MIMKMFLILILGFGPFSPIVNLKADQHQLQVKQGVQIIEQQQIYGIVPRRAIVLSNLVEQSAPLFAGAKPNFSYLRKDDLAWHRQKKKPAGSASWRMVAVPVVTQFSNCSD